MDGSCSPADASCPDRPLTVLLSSMGSLGMSLLGGESAVAESGAAASSVAAVIGAMHEGAAGAWAGSCSPADTPCPDRPLIWLSSMRSSQLGAEVNPVHIQTPNLDGRH